MPAACPLCDRPARQVNRFGLDEVAEFFTPRMVDDANYHCMKQTLLQLWNAEHVGVMRCDDCEFAFADPFVAGSVDFYRLEAPDTPYPARKWEYDRTLAVLADWPRENIGLIDVGAGKGHFLSQLINRGWSPAQLAATEYSVAGKEAINRLGVTCLQLDLRQLEASAAFDVFCMFQVLEHLDDYDALFDALARLARPDPHLFIAVPNGARIDFNERLGLLNDYPPNHISRWNRRSFQVLAARYGWAIEACELEPPTSLPQEIRYAAVNRYIRNSHLPRSWARLTYGVADRTTARTGAANKLIKALGMASSPDTWLTALSAARQSRGGTVPHALWLHLRRAA